MFEVTGHKVEKQQVELNKKLVKVLIFKEMTSEMTTLSILMANRTKRFIKKYKTLTTIKIIFLK